MFNYLDSTLTKTNNEINIAIYEKFTYTATKISSLHLWQNENAAFNSTVHRLTSLPVTNENFKKDFKTINHVARNSGDSQ